MYSPVIFDLDGTLLDTLADLASAGNHALARLDFPTHETEKYKLFVGRGIPNLIRTILPPTASQSDFDKAFEIFSEHYSAHFTDKTVPYSGISQLIAALSEKNIPCLCCTNKAHEYSSRLIEKFFGEKIAETVGASERFPRKPDPHSALYLAEKYAVNSRRPLFVGDSSVDMQTARNAGIAACGVLWGFRSREELESFSPAHLAQTPADLLKIILQTV